MASNDYVNAGKSSTLPLQIPQSLDREFDEMIDSLDLDVSEGDPIFSLLSTPINQGGNLFDSLRHP
jgi:hypothetical protein